MWGNFRLFHSFSPKLPWPSTLDYIVMQMRKINREIGYCIEQTSNYFSIQLIVTYKVMSEVASFARSLLPVFSKHFTVWRVVWAVWRHKASFFHWLIRTKLYQHITPGWKRVRRYVTTAKRSKNWTIRIFSISNFNKITVLAWGAWSLKSECGEGKLDFVLWEGN